MSTRKTLLGGDTVCYISTILVGTVLPIGERQRSSQSGRDKGPPNREETKRQRSSRIARRQRSSRIARRQIKSIRIKGPPHPIGRRQRFSQLGRDKGPPNWEETKVPPIGRRLSPYLSTFQLCIVSQNQVHVYLHHKQHQIPMTRFP